LDACSHPRASDVLFGQTERPELRFRRRAHET
jgi:hypothetical protein